MKVFSADVKVAATAYIVAETEEEARQMYLAAFGEMIGDELPQGGIVDGSSFKSMLEESDLIGPFTTLSPSVTFYGPFDDELALELVLEDDEES